MIPKSFFRLVLALGALFVIACESEDNPSTHVPFDGGNTLHDAGGGLYDAGGGLYDAGGGLDAATVHDAGLDAAMVYDAGADAGLDAGGGADAGKVLISVAGGSVSVLDGGTSPAKGAALLVRTVAGHSLVSLQVSGLDAGVTYPAHVHLLPCAMNGGDHYKLDPDAGADAGAANEIWPTLMTDDAGQARALVDVPQVLRDDAKAVIVHDPSMGNAKMLCADLTLKTPYTTSGTPAPLAAASAAGVASVSGTGSMTRAEDGKTQVTINVTNLKPATAYMVHVHDQPCAFASGGGHYKLDYSIATAQQTNEVWLNLTTDDAGVAQKTAAIDQTARAEAQSIVIHADDGSSPPTRLACIDLKP